MGHSTKTKAGNWYLVQANTDLGADKLQHRKNTSSPWALAALLKPWLLRVAFLRLSHGSVLRYWGVCVISV